jgi:hypothetical protein
MMLTQFRIKFSLSRAAKLIRLGVAAIAFGLVKYNRTTSADAPMEMVCFSGHAIGVA